MTASAALSSFAVGCSFSRAVKTVLHKQYGSGCLLVHPNFAVSFWVHSSTARGYLEMGRDMEKNLWSGHELVCGQAQILISCLVLSSPVAASFISQVVVWFKIYQENIFASSVKLISWKSRPGL